MVCISVSEGSTAFGGGGRSKGGAHFGGDREIKGLFRGIHLKHSTEPNGDLDFGLGRFPNSQGWEGGAGWQGGGGAVLPTIP